MRKELALPLIFLGETVLIESMGEFTSPWLPMIGLPLVVTLAYAFWCDNSTLAFIGGFVYPWAFPTMLFLWHYFLQGGTILYLPPEGFVFFGGIGLVFGMVGFIAAKVVLILKQASYIKINQSSYKPFNSHVS
jgi:hypothetical protein